MTRRRRSPEEQSRHDEAVRRSAAQYEARGYRVMADVPGFDRPDLIRGRRPDLIVEKGREKKVVEVRRTSTLEADRAQQETSVVGRRLWAPSSGSWWPSPREGSGGNDILSFLIPLLPPHDLSLPQQDRGTLLPELARHPLVTTEMVGIGGAAPVRRRGQPSARSSSSITIAVWNTYAPGVLPPEGRTFLLRTVLLPLHEVAHGSEVGEERLREDLDRIRQLDLPHHGAQPVDDTQIRGSEPHAGSSPEPPSTSEVHRCPRPRTRGGRPGSTHLVSA